MTYFRNFFKNLLLYLLTGFIVLFVGIIYIEENPVPSYAQMASPPASEYQDFAQCMGAKLAEYMNALVTAKENGLIPDNIKLLSPAFNMTSWTFGPISQAMSDNGANFAGLDGIAGNLYHIGNTSISSTYQSNGVQSTFGGLPLYILETGCSNPSGNDYNGCHQNLANEYQELSEIADVEAFIPFNPTNSNQDFSHHQMSDSQLQQLCNVQGCESVGINYGTHFGSSDTSATSNFGFGYNVQIANNDDGSAGAVITQTNNNSANTIIRIGVGEDDGGGFTDVNEYIEFLAQVGNGAADPNKPIYAIAGPNEPDLEYWLFPECAILFPEQARRMLQTCRGQLDIENQAYRTTVIGFGGIQPFVLEGAVQQEVEGSEDDLARSFGATLIVKAALLHPNTKAIRDTYGGSIDPASPLFINNRTDMEHVNLPAINMALPDTDIQGGFGVPPQAPLGKTEAYDAYTKRIYQTSYIQNKQELGLDEDIPVVRFNACIQRAGCDPAKEECLSGDNAGIVFKADGTPCDPNVDEYCIENYSVTRNRCGSNAENCLTNGTVFPFTGEIVMEEPTSLMVKGKVFEDIIGASLAEIPDDTFYTQHGGSTGLVHRTGVNTISDALAMNNDFENKNGLLAQQNIKGRQELARRSNQNTSIIESLSEPAEANAQVANDLSNGTYQRTTCQNGYGMSLLVENKGSYYGVKAWDTQTVGTDGKTCEDLHDYGWEVEYFMNGTKVASCGSTMQGQGKPLPTYKDPSCLADGSCSEREVYGMSIGDMCPVPFSPSDGELSVNFRVTHSNAPYHEGCTQTAQCLCSGPECQVQNATESAGVDCRICPTWAPPSLCSKILAKDIVNERQCVNGSCIASSETLVEDELPFNFDSSWNIDPWGWGAWLASIASPIFPSRLKCEEQSVVVDEATGARKDTYKCSYNATNYHVYMYPTQLVADSSLNNMHMRVNDFMFSMPEYTDKWFDTEPRKAPLQLALNIDEFFTNSEDVDIATGFDAGTFTQSGASDNFVWLGISKKDGAVRTTDIEYPNFGQPISSGYCLNQMFLAPPYSEEKKVPVTAAQSGLCDFGFVPGSTAYKQADLAQKYPSIIAKFNNDTFEQAATKLEVQSLDSRKEQNPVILSARTSSEQLEISTSSNSKDFIPTPAYEKRVKAYLASLSPKQMEQFQLEVMNDMYVLTGKNWHLRDKNDATYISPEMQKDMDALKTKYDRKMGLN